MRKKFINGSLVFLFFVTPKVIFASEPYDFVADVIQSFKQCYIAEDRIKSSNSNDFVSVMKGLVVFKNEINMASRFISKYQDNKNEFIRESANILCLIYSTVADNNENLLTFMEEMLNNPGDAVVKEGPWSRKLSEIQSENEELWRLLPIAARMSTYSLLDLKKKESGRLCCLTITEKERDNLRSELVKGFGEQIKQEAKAGMLPIKLSAVSLWNFLAQDWKPSDLPMSK